MTKSSVGLLPVVEVDGALAGADRRGAARGRWPRGTCSSSRAGCSCRTRAPTAGRGTWPRCRAGPRCRTTPRSGLSSPRRRRPTSANASSQRDRDVRVACRRRRRIGSVSRPWSSSAKSLQPVELGHRVRGEEARADPLARHLPGDVLDAVLADVQVQALAGRRATRSRGSRSRLFSWFIRSTARGASTGSRARQSTRATLRAAPQAAAGWG